jgi:hypothetical protein
MKIRFLVWILMFGLLITGCAKTVTQIVSFGDQMIVQVTLRGNVDNSANRYFLILGTSNLSVPLPPPDNITYEMIEPGTDPIQGDVADYYTNFYDTWAGYIILDPGGYYLVKGPFVSGEAITREALANLSETTNILNFSFRLDRIFDAIPDQIYFDFVSVAWPDGEAKLSSDHLSSTNAYISKVGGSILSVDDGADLSLPASLDIERCNVEIQ